MTTSHGPNRKFKKAPETRRRDEDAGIKDICLALSINYVYNSELEAFSAKNSTNHVCSVYLQGLDTISFIRGEDWRDCSVYLWTVSQHECSFGSEG